MLLLSLASTPAWAAPTLSATGTCPGPVSLTVAGGTPSASLAWVLSTGRGASTIPSGVCAGTALGLEPAGLTLRAIRANDGAGGQVINPSLPAGMCGAWVQVVDLATCTTSAAVPITPPSVSGWDTLVPITVYSDSTGAGIDELNNGDIVVATGNAPAAVVRLTPNGDVIDVQQFQSLSALSSVDAAPDGGFVASGQRGSCCTVGVPTLLRFDDTGALTWSSEYDLGGFQQGFWGVQARDDGGLFAAGPFSASVSPTGALEWSGRQVPSGGWMMDADSLDDDAVFVAGTGSFGYPAESMNHVVAKLDAQGDVVWSTAFGDGGYNWTSVIVAMPGGGAVLAGWGDGSGINSCAVSRLNPSGVVLWSSEYSAPGRALNCFGMAATSDGGFVVTGELGSRILLLKVDAAGSVVWSRDLGQGSGWDVVALSTGGYAVAANDLSARLRVIRVDEYGQTGCEGSTGVFGTSVVYVQGPNLTDSPESPVEIPSSLTPTTPSVVGLPQCL
jgi:hypothetical protein